MASVSEKMNLGSTCWYRSRIPLKPNSVDSYAVEQYRDETSTPMSVPVLVKMPPRLAVARAIATDVALFAIMATSCEN